MHEIRVSIMSPEAAEHGVAELWVADELIGYTILDGSDLMLHIEPAATEWRLSSERAAWRKHSIEPSSCSSSIDGRRPTATATSCGPHAPSESTNVPRGQPGGWAITRAARRLPRPLLLAAPC
jgi:hypothetical protein